MPFSLKHVAAAMGAGAAFTLPAMGLACSLVAPDALLLKQMMAREIASRLAIPLEQVPLDDITAPELQRPWALGPDCSGIGALHHGSGFRIVVAVPQHVFTTMAGPYTSSGVASRYRSRLASGFYKGLPWAGVRRNYWRAPKARGTSGVDYSGYLRWPEYPIEKEFGAALDPPPAPYRWPQFPGESQLSWQATAPTPVRWSLLAVRPVASLPPAEQGFCRYEGVAVVLGYDRSSPVAVHFRQRCD